MSDIYDRNIPCFGIAGNFTGHLEQAGEASDFENFKVESKNAPKAIFPTYLPKSENAKNEKITPPFLHIFPFDDKKIIFPEGENKLQIEPECGIIFKAEWENQKLVNLTPLYFAASNDCSIRKEGAKKISEKKNWGPSSKGFSKKLIDIDTFESPSILDDYRIASFLIRDGIVHPYGEDSLVCNYSYMYKKLITWMLDKFNFQEDTGPAQDIYSMLIQSGCPEKIMVSIGATRYTKWGEENFLQKGDKALVILYPQSQFSPEKIIKAVEENNLGSPSISVLSQTIEL